MARRATRPAIAAAIFLVLGTDVFFLSQRNVTTPVTLSQSIARFRASRSTTTTAPSNVAGTTTQTTTTAPAPPGLPAHPGATSTTLPRRPASQGSSAASTGPSAFVAPAEGVYVYATTGYEQISLGGSRHNYPSESYATVRRGGGCRWEFEHRVVQEHVETDRYCGLPTLLDFLGETDQETFYGQTQSVTITCDPPETAVQVGDRPGLARTFTCSLSNGGRADETVTYLGRDAVAVDGATVDAFHYLVEGRESGTVDGTSRFESWVNPTTGLPVKEVVHVQTRSQAFGATVDYQEDASYALEHATPST